MKQLETLINLYRAKTNNAPIAKHVAAKLVAQGANIDKRGNVAFDVCADLDRLWYREFDRVCAINQLPIEGTPELWNILDQSLDNSTLAGV